MPKQIPFPVKAKPVPAATTDVPETPAGSKVNEASPAASPPINSTPPQSEPKTEIPPVSEKKTENPDVTEPKEEIPEKSAEVETISEPSADKEMPSPLNMENVVIIGGKQIEITPTKVKYFRNKTASSYGYLKAVPLTEFLTYSKGVLDPKRDADQVLFDFLIAVFDDVQFVTENYNEMTADDVEQILKIFGRINHIDEKEEQARKNREAQAKKA